MKPRTVIVIRLPPPFETNSVTKVTGALVFINNEETRVELPLLHHFLILCVILSYVRSIFRGTHVAKSNTAALVSSLTAFKDRTEYKEDQIGRQFAYLVLQLKL